MTELFCGRPNTRSILSSDSIFAVSTRTETYMQWENGTWPLENILHSLFANIEQLSTIVATRLLIGSDSSQFTTAMRISRVRISESCSRGESDLMSGPRCKHMIPADLGL